ncbi:efflux RND transporter periplasmic adaptor subunit [Pedobacter metabolipauper]|uniref:HlyD family secretion protein n=1 Tax=Pedobacter metabolipauper TaxID=425513 RepID=A0A4R6SWG8_9SPHI|nr:HlyD family efflux transporter periplasmic adaptor subunit [Pedobacter metabolipauper]TDQ09761.1 HlyD family secretion protein [Pedobacter metabolipauper]
MDRELSSSFKKRRLIKTVSLASLTVILVVVAFYIIRANMEPTIERSKINVSVVGKGTVEATLEATGLVVPEYEFLITSPIQAKLEQVFRNSGEAVQAGESILQLNKDATLNDYNKLLDEQAVNHNREEQLGLNLERILNELNTQYTIKQMNIESLETALDHERALLKIGGSTDEKLKQAGLNLEISRLELLQLKRQVKNQEKTILSERKGLGYQISMQQKNIATYGKKLSGAIVQSPAKGIVTWVSNKIGAEVNVGSDLARVADLSSYKVEGKISDAYASQLKKGMEVIVKIEDQDLRGTITNIQPEVDAGMVIFFVSLNKNNHNLLRANLKVELQLVTSVRRNVLRVKNGSVFTGAEQQQIFVVQGDEAVSRTINTGLSNFNYTEILTGLRPGEKVIITELKDLQSFKKVAIKDK